MQKSNPLDSSVFIKALFYWKILVVIVRDRNHTIKYYSLLPRIVITLIQSHPKKYLQELPRYIRTVSYYVLDDVSSTIATITTKSASKRSVSTAAWPTTS